MSANKDNLILMLGAILPLDFLIQELERSIKNYKEDPSDNNYHDLCNTCVLLLSRDVTKGDMKRAMEMQDVVAATRTVIQQAGNAAEIKKILEEGIDNNEKPES